MWIWIFGSCLQFGIQSTLESDSGESEWNENEIEIERKDDLYSRKQKNIEIEN